MSHEQNQELNEEIQNTALRLALTLRQETQPVSGHPNPDVLEEDWDLLIKLLSPKTDLSQLGEPHASHKDAYFYIELETAGKIPAHQANARLMYQGGGVPICLGRMDLQRDGTWQSDIHENVDERTGFDGHPLGIFDNQQEALEAFWLSRFRAYAYQME